MNFHLQEVSVHNLGICYGALGIALVPVEEFFIFFPMLKKMHLWLWKDVGVTP